MPNPRTIISAGAGASLVAIAAAVIAPNISQYEGNAPVAYRDIGGILTVCKGHTGSDIVVNKVYTPAECTAIQQADIDKVEGGVLKVSPQLKFHTMQLAATISFSYNIGVVAYSKSSVASDFNRGNFVAGCTDMLKYVYVQGKPVTGLYNRRKQEYTICMSTLTPEGLKDVATSN